MVERFFYEKPVDAVAVEDEVGALGVLVSYHAAPSHMSVLSTMGTVLMFNGFANLREQGYELRCLR